MRFIMETPAEFAEVGLRPPALEAFAALGPLEGRKWTLSSQ